MSAPIIFDANLDAMDPADLATLCRDLRRLAHYCETRARAVRTRAAGDIVAAQAAEKFCDQIYGRLPQEWRW